MSNRTGFLNKVSGGTEINVGDGVKYEVGDLTFSEKADRAFTQSGTIEKERIKNKKVVETKLKIL